MKQPGPRGSTAWVLSVCSVVMVVTGTLAARSIARSESLVRPERLTFMPPPHVMSFRVVGPDGAPVAHPFVSVTVVGHDGEHREIGGPHGEVVVRFPDYDQYLAYRAAHGDTITLLVRVADRAPDTHGNNVGANTVAVGAAFATDPATGLLRTVFGPSGHVLMLTRGGDLLPPRVVI